MPKGFRGYAAQALAQLLSFARYPVAPKLAAPALKAFAVSVLHIFRAGAAAVGFVGLAQKAPGAGGFRAFTFKMHVSLQVSLGASWPDLIRLSTNSMIESPAFSLLPLVLCGFRGYAGQARA